MSWTAAGVLKLVAKSLYPLNVPQRPEDFVPPNAVGQSTGPWLTDWSGPPVQANDLAFGYAAVQDGRFVLLGNLYNLSQPTPAPRRCSATRGTSDRWTKKARRKSRASSPPTSWRSSEARAWPAPKFISSPTAPVRAPWLTDERWA